MPEPLRSAPHILSSPHLLDDIELIRQGVAVPTESLGELDALPDTSDVPPTITREVVLVEPEGVPIATVPMAPVSGKPRTYRPDGPLQIIGRRADRPFESLHRGAEAVLPHQITVVLDHSVKAKDLTSHLRPGSTLLLLVVATVERNGETDPGAIDLCRNIRSLRDELRQGDSGVAQVEMAIVPIAHDHPHREDRIKTCSTAYSRGNVVANLTQGKEQPPKPDSGAVLFFTGLSGSGKSTLAKAVQNRILEHGDRTVTLLDGDVVRRHLSSGLGFSPADRDLNIRRIGWVAARIAEHGGLAICSPIAPFETTRKAVQHMVNRAGARFVLIHVSTPLEECERRDRKGLYARARLGEIPDFTGISSPYEMPTEPDLRLDTTDTDVDELVDRIVDLAQRQGMWEPTNRS